DWQHEHFARLTSECVREPCEHLAAVRRAKRPTERAVLNPLQAEILADVSDAEPRPVVRDVVNDEGEKLLVPHHLKANDRFAPRLGAAHDEALARPPEVAAGVR